MCKIHIETGIPSVHAVILMGIVCHGYRRHSFPTELMFYDFAWLKAHLLSQFDELMEAGHGC